MREIEYVAPPIRALFEDPVRRIDRITRFAGDPVRTPEYLSMHKGWIAFYAFNFAERFVRIHGGKLDYEKLFRLVALHDVEECVTADVPMRVKRAIPEAYNAFMAAQYEQVAALSKSLGSEAYADAMQQHDGSPEAWICETADLLCVLAKFLDEIAVGNRAVLHFLPHLDGDLAASVQRGNWILALDATELATDVNDLLSEALSDDEYMMLGPWGDAFVNRSKHRSPDAD